MMMLFALCLSALAGDVKVHVLDVGQGDAILLEASNGKRVLVDAGTKKSNVVGQLKQRGIHRLDLVIATHAHADHIGGMPDVLTHLKPKIYVDNGMRHTTMTYRRTMAAVEESGATYRGAIQGRVFNVEDDLKLTILHPRSNLLSGTRSDLNSNSVVIRIDHGSDCILLTGDSEDPTERALQQHGIEPCEVLKVAHHGSEHSTSLAWLRAVQPKIALISAGVKNRYGHPDDHTLKRLASSGVKVHRTDLEGTLTVLSTGSGMTVTSSKKAPPAPPPVHTEAHAAPQVSGPVQQTAEGLININTADALSLDALPGVGPSRAAAIIADRKEKGPFQTCEDLQRVHGIGPKTVAKITARCTAAVEENQ